MADIRVRLEYNGRRFATRVWVKSPVGRFLFHTHPSAALELLEIGAVEEEKGGKRIGAVTLLFTPGPLRRGLNVATLRSVCAAPAIFMAKQGDLANWKGLKTYEFRQMDERDRWAYVLAITTTTKKEER